MLFNALIVMARYVQQSKRAPVEEDYERLEKNRIALEKTIEEQNQEIVELQLKIKEMELAEREAEERSAQTAENEAQAPDAAEAS